MLKEGQDASKNLKGGLEEGGQPADGRIEVCVGLDIAECCRLLQRCV